MHDYSGNLQTLTTWIGIMNIIPHQTTEIYFSELVNGVAAAKRKALRTAVYALMKTTVATPNVTVTIDDEVVTEVIASPTCDDSLVLMFVNIYPLTVNELSQFIGDSQFVTVVGDGITREHIHRTINITHKGTNVTHQFWETIMNFYYHIWPERKVGV